MQLNQIKPNKKAVNNIKRLGRGMGSGKGKTCGKGHKRQKARSGYKKKLHFEGGQMPKQRRLPKKGFNSKKQMYTRTIRLSELNKINKKEINLNCLMESKLVTKKYRYVKIILKGEIKKDINLKGLNVTKGAKLQIEENGGKIT